MMDGSVAMEDMATIVYHRALAYAAYDMDKQKEGITEEFLNALPSKGLKPSRPRREKMPANACRAPSKAMVGVYGALLWEMFDNNKDVRVEIAYTGKQGDTRVWHSANQAGMKDMSWKDLSDAGFPKDRCNKISHRHAITQDPSALPHGTALPQSTPNCGCYGDVCDYYGLPDDHPLRFFHPVWICVL